MSRLIVLFSFATLCLSASCVNLKAPAKVSECEQNNKCIDGTGGATGGKGGATAGAGGSVSHSADAGVSDVPADVPAGGRGGSDGGGGTGGSGGQASGGNTAGGSTDSSSSSSLTGGSGDQGGTGGEATGGSTGESTGGSSGTADAGIEPTPDAPIDKPVGDPDLPVDTNTKPDISPDTLKTGPEANPPEPRPDAAPDISPDRQPDRPDTAFDAPTCIQSFKSNGYRLSTSTDAGSNACGDCKTSSGGSLETTCRSMIDCLAAAWVCNSGEANCWVTCRNNIGGDMVLDKCVAELVSKACP